MSRATRRRMLASGQPITIPALDRADPTPALEAGGEGAAIEPAASSHWADAWERDDDMRDALYALSRSTEAVADMTRNIDRRLDRVETAIGTATAATAQNAVRLENVRDEMTTIKRQAAETADRVDRLEALASRARGAGWVVLGIIGVGAAVVADAIRSLFAR